MSIGLVGDGLATATSEIVHAGRRPIEIVRGEAVAQRRERSAHTDVHALCKAFTFPKTHHCRRGSFLGDAATDGARRLSADALAE